jgi:hypothetical protein
MRGRKGPGVYRRPPQYGNGVGFLFAHENFGPAEF